MKVYICVTKRATIPLAPCTYWVHCTKKLSENLLVRHNGRHGEQRKSKRERGDVYTTRVQMSLTIAVWCELAVKSRPPPPPTRPNQLKSPSQHNTTVWAPHNSMGPGFTSLHLHKTTYWPLILMALCITDFIGANALLGPVRGRGPWTLLGP